MLTVLGSPRKSCDAALREVARLGLPIWDDTALPGWVRKQCRDPSGNNVELLQRVET
jgi:hypothetical protein